MARFNLDSYATTQDRIALFVADFPKGNIQTRIAHMDGAEVIFEAKVFRTEEDVMNGVFTNGFAREVEGTSNVNSTSHVENAETSAIGRALANLGYATNKDRASRSEMIKVERMSREFEAYQEYIATQGAKFTDEAVFLIDGTEVNAKDHIRGAWNEITTQYKEARKVALAIEAATSVPIEVPEE